MSTEKQEEVKAPPKTLTYNDLLQFESPEIYSAFGRMPISTKPSAPKFGFGSCPRVKMDKVYQSKEMSKISFVGKTAEEGPKYEVTDKFSYKKGPEWKIGQAERNTLNTGAKFDFYVRKDVDFDPLNADLVRRSKTPNVRIGLESRFPNDQKRHKGTPGPQYNPSLRHEIPNSQKYSLGFRRDLKGFSPLTPLVSTGPEVGPGHYMDQKVPNTSVHNKAPQYSLPKNQNYKNPLPTWDKYQTYDTKTVAVGIQQNSKRKTLPAYSFGKSNREAKTGTFKDMMATQPTKIRIEHPKI